jgi:hypothetical protein
MMTKPVHLAQSPGRSATSQCYPTRQSDQSKVPQPPGLVLVSVPVLQIRCSPLALRDPHLPSVVFLRDCAWRRTDTPTYERRYVFVLGSTIRHLGYQAAGTAR